jgi:hypothetical protein
MNDAPLPSTAAPVTAPSEQSRIDWLFRDALRCREIHPLMRLIRLHREPNRAPAPDTERPPSATQA